MNFRIHMLLLLGLLVYNTAEAAPTRLDENDDSRTFLRGWLLFDDPATEGVRRKGPTPKSVFIAPVVKDLPDCAQGYYADAMGRCHRVFQLNQTAQLGFLLQKLNAMYANNNDKLIKKPSSTEGPLHVPIPLALQPPTTSEQTPTTISEQPLTTSEPQQGNTQEVEMVVVAADVEIKDEKQSTSVPGAILTLWQVNSTDETSTNSPDEQSSITFPDQTSTFQEQTSTLSEQPSTLSEQPSTQEFHGTTQTEQDTTLTAGTSLTEQGSTLSEQSSTILEPSSTISEQSSTMTETETTLSEQATTTSPTEFLFEREYTQQGYTQQGSTQQGSTLSEQPSTLTSEFSTLTGYTQDITTTTEIPAEDEMAISSTTPRDVRTSTTQSDSDIKLVDSESANSADDPLTFELPTVERPWEDRPVRWPQQEQQGGWSWGPWQHTTTPKSPFFLNFWTAEPTVPDPTIRTRTGLRHSPTRYPATYNGRPAPLYYQELTRQDVATVLHNQNAWYRGQHRKK